jgi:hypothetical protein
MTTTTGTMRFEGSLLDTLRTALKREICSLGDSLDNDLRRFDPVRAAIGRVGHGPGPQRVDVDLAADGAAVLAALLYEAECRRSELEDELHDLRELDESAIDDSRLQTLIGRYLAIKAVTRELVDRGVTTLAERVLDGQAVAA